MFFVVLVAELFAFFLALAPIHVPITERWNSLGLISLFIQWCSLMSCAMLCLLRPYLKRFSNIKAGIFSFLIILGVILIVSELTFLFIYKNSIELYPPGWHANFLLRNLLLGALITGPVLRYFYIQNQWRRNVRAETESRVQALQSRIRPHFLFNSMNTIAALTRSDPEKAETAVENLADLFRATLSDAKKYVQLDDELELCERYIEIEQFRLNQRLNVSWNINIPGDALMPALLLQPLIENAIYHGIESNMETGTIAIDGKLENRIIYISITNSISESIHSQKGNQIAQENVRERLQALYGKKGKLTISESNNEYRVDIEFPYESRDNIAQHEDFDR